MGYWQERWERRQNTRRIEKQMDENFKKQTGMSARYARFLDRRSGWQLKLRDRQQAREKALRAKAEAATSEKTKRRLLHRAEARQIKANGHNVWSRQLAQRSRGEINAQEWGRINRTRRNHRLYDAVSAVVRRFQPKNPLRKEGMEFAGPDMPSHTDRGYHGSEFYQTKYKNKGRIFLGGTKAMNLFEDDHGKQWLCKEAVTCVGTPKPEGALVTEAASRLQHRISPDTAVHAFAYTDEKGRVTGSLQERLDVKPHGFDLFKWQADTSKPIPAHLPDQILREHVTDWLLCNFDTKGENFLEDTQGRLRGIDKEQAFSYLGHKDAQHMSYQFSPNPNKTLYNSVFELYAQGKMDLDLGKVDEHIRRVEAIPDEEYVGMFSEVVAAKCKGDPKKMEEMNAQILARKTGLRAEYERFFGELARERGETELLDENGNFSFAKAAEKTAEAGGRTAETAEKTARAEAPEKKAAPLDRSQFEKPLTLEESLQAQKLQRELGRAVTALDRRMDAEGVSAEERSALGEVKAVAQTIKDYNAKRLTGRITKDESVAFHQLLDPAHAEAGKAAPEVVRFTQELRQVMEPEREGPAKAQAAVGAKTHQKQPLQHQHKPPQLSGGPR